MLARALSDFLLLLILMIVADTSCGETPPLPFAPAHRAENANTYKLEACRPSQPGWLTSKVHPRRQRRLLVLLLLILMIEI